MKKILMFAAEFPPTIGGIATYAVQLALTTHEMGHDITVVSPEFGEDLSEKDRADYPFRVIRYNSSGYSARDLPSMIWRAWRLCRSSRYDIIHAVDWPDLAALGLLNKFKHVRFVATIYGSEVLRAFASNNLKFRLQQNLFKMPHHIYAISEFTRTILLNRCPTLKKENVSVTMLGVNSEIFDKAGSDLNIREIYSIPEDHKILLTVARISRRKGHIYVLNALRELSAKIKHKFTYMIVGGLVPGGNTEISYEAELHRLAEQSGANVIFTGRVSKDMLKSIYAGSDIFCMTPERMALDVEGFGLVYLEAAAQGLPSIAGRIGGVPEVVLHEKTGLLVETGDISELARALTRLLTEESFCQKLGRAALDQARTFTWKRCAEQTYEL